MNSELYMIFDGGIVEQLPQIRFAKGIFEPFAPSRNTIGFLSVFRFFCDGGALLLASQRSICILVLLALIGGEKFFAVTSTCRSDR
ncbi:hypothetical protein EUGRSUZ_D01211 [Eucalyptus grandis]|uniref:Uncharacterized protein n=3 Tax=Eucalyptus grandis TaxID=71139 RepID=A0A059CEH1_EUCGR|nr:hypothetical protein EUGRSUZ_D01211 [Eucalyptus grandis]KAK3433930.1 hypothetical protein EUGRSUZ_D01211 [Eucalyptus grandis]